MNDSQATDMMFEVPGSRLAELGEAERDRDRLREAVDLLLGMSGAIHYVVDGPNAGWKGGTTKEDFGYYDEDSVDDPECPVCAVERRACELAGIEWVPRLERDRA